MQSGKFEPIASTSSDGIVANEETQSDVDSIGGNSSTTTSESSEYEPSCSTKHRIHCKDQSKVSVDIDYLALMSDKTGVSDRSVATLASAVLEGAGIVSKCDTSHVIDRSKVRRARKRVRSEIIEESKSSDPLESIYFDGRIDTTKFQEVVGSRRYVKSIKEDHISLIQEPGSHYLGHITPLTGSAKNVSSSIMDFLFSNDIDTNDLKAIGCDGTAVNTGHKGGIIRLLEEKLERPLHWFVCLLHANELPLRHLMKHIDGKTTGPATFNGPIGNKLYDCEKLDITNFAAIESEFINLNSIDLSTDQQYLLQIYNAISSGHCSNHLARKNPGKMHHARWLTTANRILRLYISEPNPSSGLGSIVNYIMKMYVPVWFSIKVFPSVFQGAKHLFKMITGARSLEPDSRIIVFKVIENNAYFAHPENLLLAMIGDDNIAVRELGYRRILKARTNVPKNLRPFKMPKLLLNAKEYHEMIDWQTVELTEPSITKNITNDEIHALIKKKEKLLSISDFPCHTQAVERTIKLVTEASMSVIGPRNRDGFIHARIEGRKRLPVFETKGDY